MCLAAVTPAIGSFPISRYRLGVCGTALLVVVDIFWRVQRNFFRPTLEQGASPARLAEDRLDRYQELTLGAALLGATALSAYHDSKIGLLTTSFVSGSRIFEMCVWVRPTYGRAAQVPLAFGLWAAWFFCCLTGGTKVLFYSGTIVKENLIKGAAVGFLPLLIHPFEGKIFKILVNIGCLNAPYLDSTLFKINRIRTLFTGMQFPAMALCLGSFLGFLVKARHVFDRRWHLSQPAYYLSSTFLGVMMFVGLGCCAFQSLHDLLLRMSSFGDIPQRLDLAKTDLFATSQKITALRRQLMAIAYQGSCLRLLPDSLGRDLIKACQMISMQPDQIQEIFKLYLPLLPTHQALQVIEQFQSSLPPEFLSAQANLWTVFNEGQIKKLLLTPELKELLEDESELKVLADAIAKFVKFDLIEGKVVPFPEDKWHAIYPIVRPLYEKLEISEKVFQPLNFLPDKAPAKELILRLKRLKTTSQELNKLTQNLETAVGDLFQPVSESLATLTAKDIEDMFKDWDEDPSNSPFSKITEILTSRGIKWKGDLIQKGILQQGDKPDNSKDALKARIESLIFS